MKFKHLLAAIFCLAALAVSAAVLRDQSLNHWQHLLKGNRLVLGQDSAWVVHDPRAVILGDTKGMVFWKDGREGIFLVQPNSIEADSVDLDGRRTKEPSGVSLHFVDLMSGSARLRLPLNSSDLGSISWIGKSEILFVGDWSYKGKCCLVEPESKTVVPAINELGEPIPIPSEAKGIAAIAFGDRIIIGQDRPVMDAIALYDFRSLPPTIVKRGLPKEANDPVFVTKDFELICQTENGGLSLNIVSGAVRKISQAEWELDTRIQSHLEVDPYKGPLKLSDLRKSDNQLWLSASRGPIKDVLLSREATRAVIDERGERVLFSAHGAGFVARITPIDYAEAKKSVVEMARRRAEAKANIAANVVDQYAVDHDLKLPLLSTASRKVLRDYIQEPFDPEEVVWTNLHGQDISQRDDSIPFELGYVLCPGGRFTVYLNSLARWVPDAPN